MKIFIILAMVFAHILDDFVLQISWLSKGKQKSWWREQTTDERYDNDYIVGLIMHSLSWSFMIMLPIAIANKFCVDIPFLVIFLVNTIIHGLTDNLKANKFTLNLVEDQTIHILQIITTWIIFMS